MSNVSEMVDSADQAKDELVANLRRVISDAEDLLAATAGDADSKIAELRARARKNLAVARDKLADAATVLLDCFVEDRSIASVTPDEVRGGRAATEILIAKGHRRIGFITNSDPVPATFGRLQGYQQALAAHGIDFDAVAATCSRPS